MIGRAGRHRDGPQCDSFDTKGSRWYTLTLKYNFVVKRVPMPIVVTSAKGQVLIPVAFRKKIGLKPAPSADHYGHGQPRAHRARANDPSPPFGVS